MIKPFPEAGQPTNDEQIGVVQFDFSGEWLPDVHPLKISNGNFSDIQNVRYTKNGLEGINGYTRINTTALSSYPNGRVGIQLKTAQTTKSFILTQQFNSLLDESKLFINIGVPPNTADFETSSLHTDPSDALEGSFVEVPRNNVVYCNGAETLIYGGDEQQIGSFMVVSSISGLTLTNPIYYDEIKNTLTDSDNIVVIDASTQTYLIGSTRPLQGAKVYILSGNGSNSTLTVKEWTGTTWSNVSGLVDNTSVGGKSHAQTGTITWNTTVSSSKPVLVNNEFLYWYQFSVSTGSFTIYYATVNPPLQKLVDLWDGINRICVQCQISRSGVYEDYTGEVYDLSTVEYPIAAKFSALAASDHAIMMFNDRMNAIKFSFIAGLANKNAATLSVYYWNGSAWTTVGTVYDGTVDSGGTKSFAQSGDVFWNPPSKASEHKVKLFDVFAYAYKFVWSNTLTSDSGDPLTAGVYVDTIYGVPVPKTIGAYKFAFNYKNRVFLAGDLAGKEGHGIDFGFKDTADSFNGEDSSDNGKRLYVGNNSSDLVCACNVFNRFGANIYNSELLLKPNGVFLLDGDDAESFKINQISDNIGCNAPRSLTTAEVAFEVSKDAIRNIAMWISNVGPIIFDAAILVPLRGIDSYFDSAKDNCVNFNALEKAHSWFDPHRYLWNVCLPSGAGQETCNIWLAYDLINKRWLKFDVGNKYVPQATIRVIDDHGNIYFYGLIDSGYMVKLDNGNLWDGEESIEGYLVTNEFLPFNNVSKNSILRNVKLITEGDGTVDITYTRSDMQILGAGIESGTLRTYGELIEDPTCTASYWSGDNFVCKEFIEKGVPSAGNWEDVAGVVTVTGDLLENIVMQITTVAGNFLTAGFLAGLLITTTDPNNPGPFLCSSIAAGILTFATGKATEFLSGNLTLYAIFIKVEHFGDGDLTGEVISFQDTTLLDSFTKFKAACDFNNLTHRLKFTFLSTAANNNIKPLLCELRFIASYDDN